MQEENSLEQQVLLHVARSEYHPVKPRVIAKQLGLPDEDRPVLRKTIKRLIKQGKLAWGERHHVRAVSAESPPASRSASNAGALPELESSPTSESAGSSSSPMRAERKEKPKQPKADKKQLTAQDRGAGKSIVTGTYKSTSKGYGFVRPTGTEIQKGRTEDIYIPLRQALDAADGDLVAVRVRREKPGADPNEPPRKRGEVVEVLERDTHQFVGTYVPRAEAGFVLIDGGIYPQPIYVGDAGAKNAMTGDKVVIEMVRFPSHKFAGEGVVIEVLGKRGEPGVDTLSIIREYGLPDDFSEESLEVARTQAEKFDESVEGRLDLTAETIITIDPKDARDFDDAISLERIENGHWRLGVHIADVSHFVPPGSALDDEALDRATSVYLPDRVIPMLPEIISNNLASLQPDRVRYTKTAFIEFTPDGAPVATDLHSAAIRSKRRFTYEEVDEYLADREAWREKITPPVHDLLARMHELAMILRRRRLDGGAIELTLPEVKIDLDNQGRVAGAHTVKHTESHQIIEEFMLAANTAVAEHLRDKELNFLRRVHEPPMRRKLQQLTTFVRDLGFECESLESRFEIKRIVAEVEKRPERHAVNYAVLRSMQKAVYSPMDEGHYALASECYCHFTSPIRRYPDLTIHRQLAVLFSGKRPPGDFQQLELMGEHCSEREQRAEAAERELTKIKLLDYMSKRIGQEMDAVVTGVEEYGLFVQGTDLPAEGLIHISSLSDDYYQYESRTHSLTGRRAGNAFRLGDLVRVVIVHVDIDRRELDFRLVRTVHHRATSDGNESKPSKDGKQSDTPQRGGKPKSKTRKPTGGRSGKKQGKRRR
ncbi:MAG: ribonuclease R [Pirellulaceae bacterium]